jgi:hypothetical protein
LGIALGYVGMSLQDFERCTPFEFSKIVEQAQKKEEDRIRLTWEQTRFISLTNLSPYSKKALKPTDIMEFPWDKKENQVHKGTSSYERMKELEKRLKKV